MVLKIIDPHRTFLTDLKQLSPIFCFANLPQSHPLYSKANVGIPGMWKIVSADILEYYGLGPTTYSLLLAGDKNEIKAAGVDKSAARKAIRHAHFKRVVEDGGAGVQKLGISRVVAISHELFVVETSRLSLPCLNLSRFFYSPNVSVPFGHYELRNSVSV
jgi:hypothetical protein